ncbi:hypothetical protein QYM36_019827, partial [Artemia franciscana]
HLDIKTENHSPLQGIIRSAAPRILYEKSRPQFRYRHVDEKLLLRVPCLLEPSTVNHEKEFQQRKPLKFSMGYSRNWINSVCGEAMWCDSRIYEKRTLNKLKMISFDDTTPEGQDIFDLQRMTCKISNNMKLILATTIVIVVNPFKFMVDVLLHASVANTAEFLVQCVAVYAGTSYLQTLATLLLAIQTKCILIAQNSVIWL